MAIRDGRLTPQVNNRIWRNVDADTVPEFERAGVGWIVRARYNFQKQLWMVSDYGVPCYCSGEIPSNWTYFYVTPSSSGRIEIVPEVGDEEHLYRRFRIGRRESSLAPQVCLASDS